MFCRKCLFRCEFEVLCVRCASQYALRLVDGFEREVGGVLELVLVRKRVDRRRLDGVIHRTFAKYQYRTGSKVQIVAGEPFEYADGEVWHTITYDVTGLPCPQCGETGLRQEMTTDDPCPQCGERLH